MMFADLNKKAAPGGVWDKHAVALLSDKWRDVRVLALAPFASRLASQLPHAFPVAHVQLLSTGGVFITCYDVGESRMLVTLQRGWHGSDLKQFLLEQPEVDVVEWDSVKYTKDGQQRRQRTKGKSSRGPRKESSGKKSGKDKPGKRGTPKSDL